MTNIIYKDLALVIGNLAQEKSLEVQQIPKVQWIILEVMDATDVDQSQIIIKIDDGSLRGRISQDYWGKDFYSFQGIPYAEPPIGDLRFKAPKPKRSWDGVLNVTSENKICPQLQLAAGEVNTGGDDNTGVISEDCLYLNVYSSKIDASRPVMVYIYGGGLIIGSTLPLGPEFLMTTEIVLVTIQYRIGVLGFLNFEDEDVGIYGNAGFKDQVLALKWVQKNIHAFGGNPNLVTIFGHSAGGASVNLLMLSPMATGLFHKAISQSAVSTNSFLFAPKYGGYKFANSLNCSVELKQIAKCLQAIPAMELVEKFTEISPKLSETGIQAPFALLTIERHTREEPFLTEHPEILVNNGRLQNVPFMVGYDTHEGILFTFDNPLPKFLEGDYGMLVPVDLNISENALEYPLVKDSIKNFYYGNNSNQTELYFNYTDVLMDELFVTKLYRTAKKLAKYLPVYLYNFDYYLEKVNNIDQATIKGKVYHGAELQYLFYTNGSTPRNFTKDSKEWYGINWVLNLWTDFAKSKDRIPHFYHLGLNWKPIVGSTVNYLRINEEMNIGVNPLEKRMTFWEGLYDFYGIKLEF